MILVLYFNGLGNGETRWPERLAVRYLARRGIDVRHVSVDWFAGEPFPALLDRMTAIVRQELAVCGSPGNVVLLGVSAGGSLAVNIFGQLRDERLSVVALCGRLRLVELSWWDIRSLERMSHLGTPKASQCFFDSVTHCSSATIPDLTPAEKRRIITVQQWVDDVVPRPAMPIPDVSMYRVPGIGHMMGIAAGIVRLPTILRVLSDCSTSSQKR